MPQTEGLRQQRDHSLPPLDAWWCELLETGTLWGADPEEPHRAVSNSYQRKIEIETKSGYGGTNTQIRHVTQLGIYDQARQIEPRLKKNYVNAIWEAAATPCMREIEAQLRKAAGARA